MSEQSTAPTESAPASPAAPPASSPVHTHPSRRRTGVLLLLLVGAVVLLASLLLHQVQPAQAPGTTLPVRSGASGAGTLAVTPRALALTCDGIATVTLANTSALPATWRLSDVPALVLPTTDTPQRGLLAAGASTTLHLRALGRPGSGTLRLTEESGAQVSIPITVTCG